MTIILVVAVLCLTVVLIVALACLCSYLQLSRGWNEGLIWVSACIPGTAVIATMCHESLKYLWVHR